MRVVIVGAGLGGLGAAVRLAGAGHSVTLLEKNRLPGGKMNLLEADGFRFDTGPSLVTMPGVLADTFKAAGRRMEDYLTLEPLDPICRYNWPDGSRLDFSPNLPRLVSALRTFSPGDVTGFFRFLAYARTLYERAGPIFLMRERPRLRDLFSRRGLDAARIDAHLSMDRAVRRFFRDPRLVQLFDRYATYNGSSPYQAPATLAMIPYIEMAGGGWYIKGGIYRLVEALMEVARELGVGFQPECEAAEVLVENRRPTIVRKLIDRRPLVFNAKTPRRQVSYGFESHRAQHFLRSLFSRFTLHVSRTGQSSVVSRQSSVVSRQSSLRNPQSTVLGVRLKGGGVVMADCVVVNADPIYAYRSLVPEAYRHGRLIRRLERLEPSSSAFVMLLGVKGDYPSLAHHNIFFSNDYRDEFDAIFRRHEPAPNPTIYVANTSRSDPSQAPPGHSNLFVLVNAPAHASGVDWDSLKGAYRDMVISRLGKAGLSDLCERIVFEQVITPQDFQDKYNSWHGSIYGLSSNSRQTAFLRPPNRAPGVGNLYFVGGSVHPGGGIPLVLLSARLVERLIK